MYEKFLFWLRQQPANASYDFIDVHNCPLAQFGKSQFPSARVYGGSKNFRVFTVEGSTLHQVFDHSDHRRENILVASRTYGELLRRLEALT